MRIVFEARLVVNWITMEQTHGCRKRGARYIKVESLIDKKLWVWYNAENKLKTKEKEVEVIPISEVGWVAGFLEGEGFFTLVGRVSKTPRIEASQVDICPIDRLHAWFGGKVWMEGRGGEYGRFRGNRQPVWKWYVQGTKAIEIMMTIWPLVGTKRRIEIEKVIEVWKVSQTVPEIVSVCKNCGSGLGPENIEWVSREDGKGRRKWCKSCGHRVS